jgi:hypothetical protein
MIQAAFDRIRSRKPAPAPAPVLLEGRIAHLTGQMTAGIDGSGLFSDTFRLMQIETAQGLKSAIYFEDDHKDMPLDPRNCHVRFSLRALPHGDYGAHEAIDTIAVTGAVQPKLVINR